MRFREVLVSVEHADGTAGVVMDYDGDVWLSGMLEDGGGTLLDDFAPAIEGLPHGRTVQGGRLPPGAVGAVVVDARGDDRVPSVGGGAWVIVLESPAEWGPLPARCVDADGEPVRPPLPPEWQREPIADAAESCAACGALDWELVTVPSDESDLPPRQVATCRRCGHEGGGGSTGVYYGPSDEEVGSDAGSAADEQQERLERDLLASVDFTVYAVAGHDAAFGGWGSDARGVIEIRVHQDDVDGEPSLVVVTSREPDPYPDEPRTEALLALEPIVGGDDPWPPPVSAAAHALWFEARDRERRRALADARVEERRIAVDGWDVVFTVASLGDRWAAVARDPPVTVTGDGVPIGDVALTALPGRWASEGV